MINEGTIFPVKEKGRRVGYAYHVPYRSVLSRREVLDVSDRFPAGIGDVLTNREEVSQLIECRQQMVYVNNALHATRHSVVP